MNPEQPRQECFARRHIRPGDFAYYDYARAVSHASGVFYSDDRRDSLEFGQDGVSNRTILDWRTRLEHEGWLSRLDKGKSQRRNPANGQMLPIRYRVLAHEEWILIHPGKCRYPKHGRSVEDLGETPAAEIASGQESPAAVLVPPGSSMAFHRQQYKANPAAETAAKVCKDIPEGKELVKAEAVDTAPKAVAVSEEAAAAYSSIGFDRPVGHPPFQIVWLKNFAGRGDRWLTDVMEDTIQECQQKEIRVPTPFFDAKRDVEYRENIEYKNGKRR